MRPYPAAQLSRNSLGGTYYVRNMVGGGLGLLALVAYALFCWLVAPAALIALVLHRRRKEALGFVLALSAVWWGRIALSTVGPIPQALPRLFGLAILEWALMLAQFAIPAALVVRVVDLEQEMAWLFTGRAFGWLLVADGVVVWVLASKQWLVPVGTETWLEVGAFLTTLAGLALLDRSQRRAA